MGRSVRSAGNGLDSVRRTDEYHRLVEALSDLLNKAQARDLQLTSNDVSELLRWAHRTAPIGDYCQRCWHQTDDDPTRWPYGMAGDRFAYRCVRCGATWSTGWAEQMLNQCSETGDRKVDS